VAPPLDCGGRSGGTQALPLIRRALQHGGPSIASAPWCNQAEPPSSGLVMAQR